MKARLSAKLFISKLVFIHMQLINYLGVLWSPRIKFGFLRRSKKCNQALGACAKCGARPGRVLYLSMDRERDKV